MIRRYLRIYYMQPDGQLVGGDSVVSNVLMPATCVPGTELRAGKVAMQSQKRRHAAVSALVTELRRRSKPRFLGVGLVLCEAARSGEGRVARRFVGSYAALGADQSILAGDVSSATLDQTTSAMADQILDVLRERSQARSDSDRHN